MAGPVGTMLLRYKKADASVQPSVPRGSKKILSHKLIQPTLKPHPPAPPPPLTRRIVLTMDRHIIPEVGLRWFVGNMTLVMPDEPLLSPAHYKRSYEKTSVLHVKRNEVIDFVFNNIGTETGPHPFHLHGHQMWYLGVGTEAGLWNTTRDVAKLNIHDPPLCDVFEIPHNGWAAVRVKVDNAGAWIFHCHISPHHMAGMGFVMMVDADCAPPPPRGFPTHCRSYPSRFLWPNIV